MDQHSVSTDSPDADSLTRELQTTERRAHEQIARILAEGFREIEQAIRSHMEDEYDSWSRARVEEVRRDASREFSDQLSRCFRRMREAADDRSWSDALLAATVGLCRGAALFVVRDGSLWFEGGRGLPRLAGDVAPVPVESGSALSNAVNEGRTVYAARTEHDLSPAVAAMFRRAGEARVALVPVVAGGKVAALLAAESADLGALEMVAGLGGAVRESRLASQQTAAEDAPSSVEMISLSAAEAAARRFARSAVARMVLESSQELKAGRESGSIYDRLYKWMDAARAEYEREHRAAAGRDYLHEEFVHVLAQDRAELLGPSYPGPLL